jgi:8-oxo-dGTP diphosphatase
MKHATLCYLLKENKILLGFKKRGMGEGLLNGYGGKIEEGEDVESAAIREVKEESSVVIDKKNLEKVAVVDFFFTHSPHWNQTVHVFLAKKWKGEAEETEEMKPEWHDVEKIPIEKMWGDDAYWLHHVLDGKKVVAEFTFGEDNKTIIKHEVNVVDKV